MAPISHHPRPPPPLSSIMPPSSSPTLSLPYRTSSALVMLASGLISKVFLNIFSKTEVHNLPAFLSILDSRRDPQSRTRGLITVSNHISVLDDPLIWGVLPLRYMQPCNLRWSLGSYDICFKNRFDSTFFTLGQVLPTHRSLYSAYGGLFQTTLTQCIRLLSSPPFPPATPFLSLSSSSSSTSQSSLPRRPTLQITDPFSSPPTYSTTPTDCFPAPASLPSHRHSWIHIFPEGKIHQHPQLHMRYFKWGVARLILESDPIPQFVPMWIEGLDQVMHESRSAPRWLPRGGRRVAVWFGEEVDVEKVFGGLRRRWKELVRRERETEAQNILAGDEGDDRDGDYRWAIGNGGNDSVRFGREARAIREECARRVREEVLRVRRMAGWNEQIGFGDGDGGGA